MSLLSTFIHIQEFLLQTGSTLSSLIKILVYPRGSALRELSRSTEELVILGNGPSLKPFLRDAQAFLAGKSLMAVNYAALSEEFTVIRPRLYMVVDPAFFLNPKDRDRLFPVLRDKVSWPMDLIVSAQARKGMEWLQTIRLNSNIHIHYISIAPIEGYRRFCHLAYRKGWGMPRPRNVLIPSIMTGLRMGFKRIYLSGADHSWLKEIWVNQDNEVVEDLQHFYDRKGSIRSTLSHPLHEILYSMYIAFRSYHIIQEYSQSLGIEVINITEGSFIDAFPRLSVCP